MKNILEYQVHQKLYESNSTVVYRADRKDGQSLILKVLKPEPDNKKNIDRYYNEHNITQSFRASSRIISTYGLEQFNDTLVMLMEDFGATSLDLLLNQKRFSLEHILDIVIKVIEGLDEIHSAGIVHKDINPSNIVMNPDTGQVKIIGFGIASSIKSGKMACNNSNIVEGTLSYIPPEQTGRINQTIDHRADFYSFGATLYELLAHKPPFNRTDHMDLIHSHLAKEPIPLSSICFDIPEALSKIVMKLMSKDAEERYATAKDVKADLQKCLDRVKKGERNFSFPIGDEDSHQALKIAQKIFGRKKEMELLQSNFQQVLAGKKNLVFIKGPAGIGKTFLIQEIEQYVLKKNGIFITGKFNLLQQAVPYTGIIQAFRQLARHLLTRSDHELDNWQKKITASLGNQGYEIIELVPEFKKILGPKSSVSGLEGQEARNRFYLMVENFLSVFAGKNQPLVVFLDDLQWVDPSSLEFIKQIVSSPVIESIYILCAFRDNEVDAAHPLQAMLESLKNEDVEYESIELAPLDLSSVSQLISECLDCSSDKARPLAQWIHTRSLGNPFYSNELLSALNKQKKLIYDRLHCIWNWDLREIQALSLPDNITELLAKKVKGLARHAQNILIRAACIGTTFELSTLTIVCERSRDDILASLKESKEAGLILQMDDIFKSSPESDVKGKDNIYKFVHDRIHSAAYNLMPRDQKPKIHRQTGQLLLRKLPQRQRDERIFEIVNQLNKGRALLIYRPEKKELACLNLEAAQKAKASAAFDQAYTYFKIGINLLESTDDPTQKREKPDTHHWQESYELISKLYLGAIETAYLSTRFDEVERLGKIFLANAACLSDRLCFYSIKVQACYALNLMEEAVTTSLYALGLAGIQISGKPEKWEIALEYLKTRFRLSGRSMESLAQIPTATDSEKLTILNIMRNTLLPSYYVNSDLFPILVFKAIRISIRHGSTVDSAFAFAGYGMILSGVIGNLEKGYQFGCLAVRMLESFDNSDLGAKILVTVSTFTTHWKEHLKNVLPLLEKAREKGLETGDFEFTAIAAHLDSYYRFFLGENLSELKKRGEANIEIIKRLKQKTMHLYQSMHLQTISNLKEKRDTPHKLTGSYYDEDVMLPIHLKANDAGALFNFYLQKTILCFLFGHPQKALENICAAEKYIFSQRAATDDVEFCFYSSLANLTNLDTGHQKRKRLKQIKKNQKKMKKWAKSAPMNYEHKYLLLEAEYCRVKNRPEKATVLYDMAIKKAVEHGYVQEAAIASELAGRFYLTVNNPDKSREHLKQAWHDYFKWGASAKLSQLEACYPDVFPAQTQLVKNSFDSDTKTIVGTLGEFLDWNAILESSVSISSEIQFEKLVEKLIQIVTKNTGAQKGVFLLWDNTELKEAAVYPIVLEQKKALNAYDSRSHSQVPASVIRYVERIAESVIFDYGDNNDPLFKNDPYIVAHRPKSFLCFPLQYKSKLLGIFYLENRLVAGTFTSHTLEILKILSAQISVSLENATLYRDINIQAQKSIAVNKKLEKEIEHRRRIETELKGYHDKLKKDLDTQALELLKSKETLAKIADESNRRHRFRNIIGKNDQMQKIYDLIEELSDVNANVLIVGESGTGKELVAEALHSSGSRKEHPFVRVNCAALSENLLESELFGHVKGAFTGADKNKIGRFQQAGSGSILLDEIGDVSLHFQKRLLRVLQEREYEQLGDTKTIQMNARIIASTNQDLQKKVTDTTFREDLYYRLKVVEIKLPPLRDRKGDIPLLTNHFLTEFNTGMSKNIASVSEDVYSRLMAYHWPGNIRELKNIIEHAVITCKTSVITMENLPDDFILSGKNSSGTTSVENNERERILNALENSQWNKTQAARLLNIGRRTLYRKLKEHSIQ